MKTMIDSIQSIRLKDMCEKHGIELPHDHHVCEVRVGARPHLLISLTELLDWLLKEIRINYKQGKYKGKPKYINYLTITNLEDNGRKWYVSYDDWGELPDKKTDNINPDHTEVELIDALLELFIWTIKNKYYKGI